MKNNIIYLSVVIPLFNEEKRLKNLKIINEFLKSQKIKSELIVVNDGSSDKTLRLIKRLSEQFPLKIITYKSNCGKGYALKTGMLAAKGKYHMFTDIDLSTPIETINQFLKHANKYQIIIGTRKHSKSQVIIRQPKWREFMGKVYTLLSNLILNVNVTDLTCGFKFFSKDASQEIFSRITTNRWGFDAEAIMLARQFKYKLLEVPVIWSNERQTRVKLPQDAISSLLELIKIKLKTITNQYKLN
jgi:dolichyl-phosphate beta-glucosyltransferase